MSPAAAPTVPIVEHDALPVGTRFGEFEIERVLGVGGFGIVYLAHDHSLDRRVALKEYMPGSLATRGEGPVITVRSGSYAETYAVGLRSFINEARLLARFDHPSLVKVYRVWEDNATAYMVMPYLQGITLRDARRAMSEPPDETWIRAVLNPMLDALELLHREGVFHRDVAPDNILLPPRAQPILLDFGAARRVISDRTQTLTAILKPSYAPIEQYAEMTQLRQGPWTDLYALGAVMHFLLFGQPPAPATARAVQDTLESIEDRVVPGVSRHFMEIVAWMLAVRPHERPQHVEALRAALDGRTPIPLRQRVERGAQPGDRAPMPSASAPFPTTQIGNPDYAARTRVDTAHMPTQQATSTEAMTTPPLVSQPPPFTARPASVAPSPPLVVAPAYRAATPAADERAPSRPAPALPPAAAPVRTSRTPLIAAGLVGVALVLLGAFWFVVGQRNPSLDRIQPPVPASAAVTVPAVVPAATAPAPVPLAPAPVPVAAASSAVAPVAIDRATLPDQRPPATSLQTALPAATAPGPAARVGRPVPSVDASASAAGVVPPRQRTQPKPVARAAAETPVPAATQEDSPAAAEVAAPPPVATTGPATAREACSGRNFIAQAICMDRECENSRYRDQPECVKVLETKRNRQRY